MGKGDISERDLRAILGFLRANYALQDHDGFIQNVVHGLPKVVDSDLTAYCEIDPVAQASRNWLDRPEVDTQEAQRIWAERMLEMPVVAHYVETGDGRALRITDFMPQRQFRDTGVYCEHYRPKDLEYVLATWVPSSRSAIGIGFARNRKDFTDEEKLLLELLRPHLIQAWRNAQLATKLEREARASKALLALHSDVVVLDGACVPVFTGEGARRAFERHYGTVGPTGVPDEVHGWARQMAARFGDRADDVPSRVAPLRHNTADERLTLRLFASNGGVVIAVEERRQRDPEGLRALGLTRREGEVLTWVAEGKTNHDISRLLDCAPKTVEKHLEHIYQKLGVPNRTAAVAMVMRSGVADPS